MNDVANPSQHPMRNEPLRANKKKHVVFLVSNGFGSRMILRSGVAKKVLDSGLNVSIISVNANEPYFQKECEEEGVNLLLDPQGEAKWALRFRVYRPYFLDNVMGNISLRTLHKLYFRERPGLGAVCGWINQTVRKVKWCRELYRAFERWANRSPDVKALLLNSKPDLLVLCNPFGVNETVYLNHAKELGITVVCQMMSWDNITCKGTPLLLPDYFISWGPIMTEELKEYYAMPAERIYQCGVAHFDVYHRKDELLTPDEVKEELGLPPGDPYIVFGMVTPYCCLNEIEMLEWLVEKIRKNEFTKPCSLIIRPHPQSVSGSYARTKEELEKFWNLAGARVAIHMPSVLSSALSYEMPKGEMKRLASLLAGAAMCVNANSTLCLDSCLADTPVITLAFDGSANYPYEQSARAGIDYIHMAKLLKCGGVRIAKSFDDLEAHINRYLENRELDSSGRAKTVTEECGLQDGQASQRIANAIAGLAMQEH